MSLFRKVLLGQLALILLMFVVLGFLLNRYYCLSHLAQINNNLETVGEVQSAQLRRYAQHLRSLHMLMTSRTQLRISLGNLDRDNLDEDRRVAERILNDAKNSSKEIVAISVRGSKGQALVEVKDRDDLKAPLNLAIKDQGPINIQFKREPGLSSPLVDVGGVVVTEQGPLTLVMRLEGREIIDIVSETSGLGRSGESYLLGNNPIDGNSRYVVPPPAPHHPVEVPPGLNLLQALNLSPDASHPQYSIDDDGNEVLARQESLKDLGLTLIVKMDRVEIEGMLWQFQKYLLITLGVMAVVSMALSIGISRSIVRPITRTLRQMRGIQSLKDLHQFEPKTSREMEQLIRGFKSMTLDLVESEKSFRQVIDNAPVAMLIVSQEGKIVYVNRLFTEVFGYGTDAILGQAIEILLPERYRAQHPALRMGYVKAPDIRRMGAGRDLFALKKDGSEFPVEIGLNPVAMNHKMFTLASVVDITERKSIEKDLLKQREALERSNRDLDDFAHIASHDLKEPLRGIHNYSSFLIEDYQHVLDHDGRNKLTTLKQLTERMSAIIDALLQYSKVSRQDLDYSHVDLEKVVDEVLKLLKISIEEHGTEIRRPTKLPTVYCSKARISEVFNNLITNALRYNNKPKKWIEIGVEDRNGRMAFYVRDNGVGIAPEHHKKVFQIFKRLHADSQFPHGTGAGATIVKKIVERHGGEIWLESEVGAGTTAYFTLGSAKPVMAVQPNREPPLTQNIFVQEDSPASGEPLDIHDKKSD
ncbi:MAG: PAS domain S-box protein [Planctomycetota bacterium]